MELTYKGHLVIVVALEHYNPLGILRTFGEAGIAPIYVSIKYKAPVASACKYNQKNYFAENIAESYDIVMKEFGAIGANDPSKKPFLIFGDDDVYSYFEDHYDDVMARFITFNAGVQGRVTHYMEKKAIIDLAEKHGIQTLKSVVVPTGQIPENLSYPVITKSVSPVSGGYKSDFHICEDETQLVEAMNSIKSKEILIQPYVDKKTELTIEAFSYNHGKNMFAGVACEYLYTIKGYYSPLYNTYLPKDKDLLQKLNNLMEDVGFEGIWDAEFLVDKNGNLWFLEVNFRNSAWAYSSTVAGNPLALLWCEAMLTGECREPQDFEPFITMVETVDYLKRVDSGAISIAQWVAEFRQCKCPLYYNDKDLEPWNVVIENWDKLK